MRASLARHSYVTRAPSKRHERSICPRGSLSLRCHHGPAAPAMSPDGTLAQRASGQRSPTRLSGLEEMEWRGLTDSTPALTLDTTSFHQFMHTEAQACTLALDASDGGTPAVVSRRPPQGRPLSSHPCDINFPGRPA